MEFLKISDTKLKVTLTEEECLSYNIDTGKGDFSGNDIKRAVREIIALAERECDFRTEGERVLVQIYPLPNLSCELLVTRLVNISRRDRAELAGAEGLALIEKKRGVYRFPDFESLTRAVRAVYRPDMDSNLYRDDLGRYYIHTVEEITDGISELEVFVEFGERLFSLPIAVLSEYGTLLAKGNAIDKIYNGELME